MRGNAQHFQPQEGTASARCRLVMLLAGCTDQRLASFSVDSLVATHRVPFAFAAEALRAERGRRGNSV